MSDAVTTLDVLIRSKAELQGFKDAITSLEMQIGKSKALGKDYSDLQAQLDKAKASLADYSKTAVDSTNEELEGTKKLTFSKHDLKLALHALGHEFSLVSGLARYVFSPTGWLIGGVLLVTKMIHSAREAAAKFRETLERQANLSGLLGPISGVKEAVEEADKKSQAFLETLNRRNKSFKSDADELTSSLAKQAALENQIAEAAKSAAIAKLEYLHASGQLSDGDYEKARINVEAKSAAEARQRQEDLAKKNISVTQTAFDNAEIQKHILTPKITPAEEAAALAAKNADRLEENLKRARANYNALTELLAGISVNGEGRDRKVTNSEKPGLIEQYQNDYSDYVRNVVETMTPEQYRQKQNGALIPDAPATTDEIVKARAFYEKIQEERKKQEMWAGKIRELEPQVSPAKIEAQNLSSQADSLKKQLGQYQQDADALKKQLDQQKAELTAQHQANAKITASETEATQYNLKTQGIKDAETVRRQKEEEDKKRARQGEQHLREIQHREIPDQSSVIKETSSAILAATNNAATAMKELNEALPAALNAMAEDAKTLRKTVQKIASRTQNSSLT